MAKKIVVGMSGGVDSSVAAYLLKQKGYDVIGVTMQIWQEEDSCTVEREGGCCGVSAVEDARRVANAIGIPYYVLNFRREFQKNVIDYFVNEYRAGRTPNPCIACNRYVKWESLLQKSLALGADAIATGHYARVVRLPNGRYTLHMSAGTPDGVMYAAAGVAEHADGRTRPAPSEASVSTNYQPARRPSISKDQTYALYSLTQEQLARTVMPIGDFTKDVVREIAEGAGLPVAHKPDSEEICFVPDGDYAGFIERETGHKSAPGNFVDEEGHVLGRHDGIIRYTIGQRRGLRIAFGRRMFVSEIRPDTNEVVLSDNDALFHRTVTVRNLSFMGIPDLPYGEEMPVFAKIRYNHRAASAIIKRTGKDEIVCAFDVPQRAPAPGQAAVFYIDGNIACGGTIIEG